MMQWRSLILWNLIPHSLLIYHCTFEIARCWRCDPKRVVWYQVSGELQLSHLCMRAQRPVMGNKFLRVQVLQIVGRSCLLIQPNEGFWRKVFWGISMNNEVSFFPIYFRCILCRSDQVMRLARSVGCEKRNNVGCRRASPRTLRWWMLVQLGLMVWFHVSPQVLQSQCSYQFFLQGGICWNLATTRWQLHLEIFR